MHPVNTSTSSATPPRLTVTGVTEGRDRDGNLTGALFVAATVGSKALSVCISAEGRVSKLDGADSSPLSTAARKTLANALRRHLQRVPWLDELSATALHRVTCSLYPSPDLTTFVPRRIAVVGEHLVLMGAASGLTLDVVLHRATGALCARFLGPHDTTRALTASERICLARALAAHVGSTHRDWRLYAELCDAVLGGARRGNAVH